jgi:hypothetical protein
MRPNISTGDPEKGLRHGPMKYQVGRLQEFKTHRKDS